MITNHSYLDNPTFRGMRRHLMQTFDEIHLLDLHGNALKREVCPDGSPDENVFDIRQGVAIAFFIKRGLERRGESTVRHFERWGRREEKYIWLEEHEAPSTPWQELRPRSPSYLLVPHDDALGTRYEAFAALSSIFPLHSVGIVTARDALTIHWTPDEVWRTVGVFSRMDPELARQAYRLGKDARDWKVPMAQKDLLDSGPARENVLPILYRPFDMRYTYYTGRSRGFLCMPRTEVMSHMAREENLALCIGRQGQAVGGSVWDLAFCSRHIEDFNLFYRGGNVNFPLYLCGGSEPAPRQTEMFVRTQLQGRQSNLNPEVVAALAHGRRVEPDSEIFHYIYAILFTPAYRKKYAEFLRRDFPRVPFTADAGLFSEVAALGARLTELHLLRSPELVPPVCRFEGQGDGRVARGKGLRYDAAQARVYINATQYFAPVPPEVWGYPIGGYQVCHKWLKDRQERRLELDDIRTYCRIVTALGRTIAIQEELDALYPRIEQDLVTGVLN
jgi:predicted helicase